MDVVMPGLDGIEATKALRESAPDVKVLALSTFGDEDHVLPTLAAGAAGFLTKDTRPEEIAQAIRTVHRGDPVLCTEATRRVLKRVTATALGPREPSRFSSRTSRTRSSCSRSRAPAAPSAAQSRSSSLWSGAACRCACARA
jgi:DNA-binding NarL/FixJ family response regulator